MGTIAELQGKPDRLYPLLWLSNEGGSLEDNYKVDNIRLTMFGRVIAGEEGQDDDASEIEVLSDMQLILLDFLNYFHQQHGQEYVTDKAATLEHFTERTNDRTAGYSCVLELKQFYDWNKCQIPESGASIPPTVDGLTLYDFCDQSVLDRLTAAQNVCLSAEFGGAVVTEQINGVTIGTVAPGNTNDTVIENSASTPIGTAANPSVVSDSQLQINGVNTETLAATVTHDQQIHDSAGADVGTAANPSVVSDATVTINAADLGVTGDIVAEGSVDLVVNLDGSPSGSWDGNSWEVTSAVTPSASLAVSAASPTTAYLGTNLITATPSNITPTSYTFFIPNIDGTFTEVTQAGNTYNWTVEVDSLVTVSVTATDGVDEVTGTVDVTGTWTLGKAIDLNGTTQSVRTVDNHWYDIWGGQIFSLGFWVEADDLSNTPVLFTGDSLQFIQIRTTDVRLRTAVGSIQTHNTTLTTATKYFICIQRTNVGDNVEVLLNGALIASVTGTLGNPVATDAKALLGDYSTGGFEFDGRIAEMWLFKNKTATAGELLSYYNSGAGEHVYNLMDEKPFWHIDFEDRVTDQGTAGWDCELVNAPSYVTF